MGSYGDRRYLLNSNLKEVLVLKHVKIISRGSKNMKIINYLKFINIY